MSLSKRMGTELTYGRRYSLFTLIGITGENDLHSRDLDVGTKAAGSGRFDFYR